MIRLWRYVRGRLFPVALIKGDEIKAGMDSNVLAPFRGGHTAIRFARRNHDMDLAMAIYQLDQNGDPTHYAKPIEMVPVDRNDYSDHVCAFVADYECKLAQRMMDDLWKMGVRPTEHGSEGQLAALEKHLQDAQAQRTVLEGMAINAQEVITHVVRQLVDNDTRV